jgi:hypothetical protein
MYSKEKKIVITHSKVSSSSWYLLSILSTLSSITSKTLTIIKKNRTISKNLPAGVSAS